MRSTIAVLVLVLAGCGGSMIASQGVVEQGRRYPIKIAKPPTEMASCMVGNAEFTADYYSAIQRPAGPGTLELVIIVQKTTPVAVAHLSAVKPSGTAGSMWINLPVGVG